jgi:hypothetical protein
MPKSDTGTHAKREAGENASHAFFDFYDIEMAPSEINFVFIAVERTWQWQ